jgi:hypothetical protein
MVWSVFRTWRYKLVNEASGSNHTGAIEQANRRVTDWCHSDSSGGCLH